MKKNSVVFISPHNIGPYIIPSRIQNYCANYYAYENKLNIKSIVNEGLYGENLNKLKVILLNDSLLETIFISIYQLNFSKNISLFIKNFGSRKFHFLLERKKTNNKQNLNNLVSEMKLFNKIERIQTKDFVSYKHLYNSLKKK